MAWQSAAATKGRARRMVAIVEMNFMAGDGHGVDDFEVSGMGHSGVDAVLAFIPLAARSVASLIYDLEAS